MQDGPHEVAAKQLLGKIEEVILFPLMSLMMGVALLVFFWGLYQYVLNSDEGGAHEAGRTHMMYGIIGFVVMVSAYAILKIAASTVGVDIPE